MDNEQIHLNMLSNNPVVLLQVVKLFNLQSITTLLAVMSNNTGGVSGSCFSLTFRTYKIPYSETEMVERMCVLSWEYVWLII